MSSLPILLGPFIYSFIMICESLLSVSQRNYFKFDIYGGPTWHIPAPVYKILGDAAPSRFPCLLSSWMKRVDVTLAYNSYYCT